MLDPRRCVVSRLRDNTLRSRVVGPGTLLGGCDEEFERSVFWLTDLKTDICQRRCPAEARRRQLEPHRHRFSHCSDAIGPCEMVISLLADALDLAPRAMRTSAPWPAAGPASRHAGRRGLEVRPIDRNCPDTTTFCPACNPCGSRSGRCCPDPTSTSTGANLPSPCATTTTLRLPVWMTPSEATAIRLCAPLAQGDVANMPGPVGRQDWRADPCFDGAASRDSLRAESRSPCL